MLVPRRQDAQHPRDITRAPDDRVPIGVDHQQSPARPQNAVRLDQRRRHLGHILVHLHRRGSVEALSGERQRARVARLEPHRSRARHRLAPARGDRQHLLARVDPVHRTARPDRRRGLCSQQARPRTNIEHVLARREIERRQLQPALLDDVGGQVGSLELLRDLRVELHHLWHLHLQVLAPSADVPKGTTTGRSVGPALLVPARIVKTG